MKYKGHEIYEIQRGHEIERGDETGHKRKLQNCKIKL